MTYQTSIAALNADQIPADGTQSGGFRQHERVVNEAAKAIAAELGAGPKGNDADVTARLDRIDAEINAETPFGKSLTAAADAAAAKGTLLIPNGSAEGMPLYGFGHSIMYGLTLAAGEQAYLSRIGIRLRSSTVQNSGVSGTRAPEMINKIIGFDPNSGIVDPGFVVGNRGLVMIQIGLNEVLHQTDVSLLSQDAIGFSNAMRTSLRYMGASEWHGARDDFAGCSFSGPWHVGLAGGFTHYSISSGASVTCSFSSGKTSILVGLLARPSSSTQTCVITGGTSTVNFDPSNLAESWDWQFHIISVPVSTSATSITITAPSDVIYFWGYGAPSASPISVAIVKDHYPPGHNGSIGDVAATAQMDALRAIIDSMVADQEFSSSTCLIDAASVYQDADKINSDGLHPNALGHFYISGLGTDVVGQLPVRSGLSY